MTKDVSIIAAPQLNVNDETAEFLDWKVASGSRVKIGDPVCEIETMKAMFEITAEAEGVIHQIALPHTIVKVGECLGLIGKDQESINRYLSKLGEEKGPGVEKAEFRIKATAKAQGLAAKHGLALEDVLTIGVKGTVKETDVMKYLQAASGGLPALPSRLSARIEQVGRMPHQKIFMARKLKASLNSKLLTTIDAEMDLTSVNAFIRERKERGQHISLLHIVMHALGKTLSKYRNFTTFHFNDQLFRYRDLDISFIVKTFDGLLYAPVVRQADKFDIENLAQECNALTLKANRHELKPEEMEGGCFTVSCLPHSAIRRFVALIDEFQSAILAIAGEKNVVRLDNGKAVQAPALTMTLSYDHTVIDGWDSALFLEFLNREIDHTVKTR